MKYKLAFLPIALKEWQKLGNTIKDQFKKKLQERLTNPFIPKDHLSKNLYKIKLKASGYRLVYDIQKEKMIILILGIGKRNRNEIYKKIFNRGKRND